MNDTSYATYMKELEALENVEQALNRRLGMDP